MGQRAIASMSLEDFFAWQETQDELYELVDALPLQMMSGSKRRHDHITINLIVAMDAKLRGKVGQPTTQDTPIRISDTQTRRPDMMIDCGKADDEAYLAADPRAVLEVLSPSTHGFDQTKKLEEYKTVDSLTHIILINPDSPEVIAYQRDARRIWVTRTFKRLKAEIGFDDLDIVLSLAEIYRDLTFRARPVLVVEE